MDNLSILSASDAFLGNGVIIMVREGCFQNSRIAKTCQYFGRFDHDYSLLVCEKFPKNTPSICRTRQCAKIVVHGGGLSQFWQCHTFENTYSNQPSLFPYNKEKLFSVLVIYGVFFMRFLPLDFQ